MLQSRLAGVDPSTCRQAEWRRGTLPPRELGTRILDEVAADVEEVVSAATAMRTSPAQTHDLAIALSDGRRLAGTVSGLHGTTLLTVDFGRINPKRRLRAWLPYLLLAAARPDTEFDAVAIGRRGRCHFGPVSADEARAWLDDLARLHTAGLQEPLPIAVCTSFAYAGARRRGAVVEEALRKAGSEWYGRDFPGEQAEAAHERVFGPVPALDVLTAEPAGAEDGAATWPEEPSRFGVLSRRWWEPMLDAESRAVG
jgi:exodeoxyribonuclease V gamma subunit